MQGNKQIYIFYCENNICKIGISSQVGCRMRYLCKIKPYSLKYIFVSKIFDDKSYQKERDVHKLLNEYAIGHEWFSVPFNIAIQAVEKVCGSGGLLSTRDTMFFDYNLTEFDIFGNWNNPKKVQL